MPGAHEKYRKNMAGAQAASKLGYFPAHKGVGGKRVYVQHAHIGFGLGRHGGGVVIVLRRVYAGPFYFDRPGLLKALSIRDNNRYIRSVITEAETGLAGDYVMLHKQRGDIGLIYRGTDAEHGQSV